MKSFNDVGRLMRLGSERLRGAERALRDTYRQLAPLDEELQALQAQAEGLQSMLASGGLQGITLDQGQLFAALRQQAVIRRRIDLLAIDRARAEQERSHALAMLAQQQRERQRLHSKQEKYRVIEGRLRQRLRARQGRLEEIETEDLIMSTR
ncbi:type III secretion protein [Pseudomonas typographi]|uniref:Type III secretion protein n=1 Tax=Pseudomonas typographi TaxID=2715964 RepID=A0ABR7Z2A1_9PSED|nr:type III secretion protein [Pseudomonas typographi]MBD1552385.1 type III secretion protein [Pseudomonas typographi]MBD1587220.1 type III secretion protein [Pseudomonas typographi]MBD1599534.1 type III secretion protein [Pseudomonas typographi]